MAVLGAANRAVEEFADVLELVVPAFPPYYNVLHLYVRQYHLTVCRWLEQLCTHIEGFEAKDLLMLIGWADKYNAELRNVGVDPADVAPPIAEPMRAAGNAYRVKVTAVMGEWCGNIMAADKTAPPEKLNGNLWYTPAPTDLLRAFNQQIVLAQDVSSGSFLYEAVKTLTLTVVKAYCEPMCRMLASQPGDLEYLVAVCNNHRRALDQSLERKEVLAEEIEAPWNADMDSIGLDDMADGFSAVGKAGVAALRRVIFAELEAEVFPLLFQDAWLKEGDPARIIVGTVRTRRPLPVSRVLWSH